MTAVKLDQFTRGYLTCALWASISEDDPPDWAETIDLIDPDSLARVVADCRAFREANPGDVGVNPRLAGINFWLDRTDDGIGFRNENSPWTGPDAARLESAAKAFGPSLLYTAPDGIIHFD